MTHPIHVNVDCIATMAKHLDSSYHLVFKLVCKDYRTACPGKTKSQVLDYISSVALLRVCVRTSDCPRNRWMCRMAAKGGHLEVLQWARTNGCPWDTRTCSRAAEGGHLEVLQWARSNGCPECDIE